MLLTPHTDGLAIAHFESDNKDNNKAVFETNKGHEFCQSDAHHGPTTNLPCTAPRAGYGLQIKMAPEPGSPFRPSIKWTGSTNDHPSLGKDTVHKQAGSSRSGLMGEIGHPDLRWALCGPGTRPSEYLGMHSNRVAE